MNLPLISILLAYFIVAGALAQVIAFAFIKKSEIIADLKGKDKTFQLVELAAIFWFIFTPALITAAIFGLPIPDWVKEILEVIFIANLSKKGLDKYIEHRYAKPETTEESKEINEAPKKDE